MLMDFYTVVYSSDFEIFSYRINLEWFAFV